MWQKELERLEAVNRLLTLQSNKAKELQDIVALAAEICGTETAYITLLDEDTQYIQVKYGDGPQRSERKDSFCSYVIMEQEVMVIPDTTLDQRFQNNPYVNCISGIRFYAGAPLKTTAGYSLGSLCVVDQRPGELSVMQYKMLANLASQVINIFEFETTLQLVSEQITEARESEIKIRSFFESSSTIHILIDPDYRIVAFNRAVKDFMAKGYGVDIRVGTSLRPYIGEAYVTDFVANCTLALSGETVEVERLLKFGHDERWWALSYNPARDGDGEIIGISYNALDISKRVVEEQKVLRQNRYLKDISYIQSHEFRRPVSSILGFMELFKLDDYRTTKEDLIMMGRAVEELDLKIRSIVAYTETE